VNALIVVDEATHLPVAATYFVLPSAGTAACQATQSASRRLVACAFESDCTLCARWLEPLSVASASIVVPPVALPPFSLWIA
jgi:hypothetical protein